MEFEKKRPKTWNFKILSRATFPGAPSYGGVRTWVESSLAREDRALADASNLLGCKEYALYQKNTAIEH